MTIRAAILAVPLAVLAGCATAPRTTYHYDGSGDYYSGVTPGVDVVVSSAPGWNTGYPWGYGYGAWVGAGVGYGSPWWPGAYGYGYGYGDWPWWGWKPIHVLPPRSPHPRPRLQPNRGEHPPPGTGIAGQADPASRRIGALPSSTYAPLRAPVAPRALEPNRNAPRFEPQRAPVRTPAIAPARVAPPPPPPPRATPSFERAAPPARSASKHE